MNGETDPHYHVEELLTYRGRQEDSTPAYTAEQAAEFIKARANRVGLHLDVDDFGGEHRATWTWRACYRDDCEMPEDAWVFYRLMREVEGSIQEND